MTQTLALPLPLTLPLNIYVINIEGSLCGPPEVFPSHLQFPGSPPPDDGREERTASSAFRETA